MGNVIQATFGTVREQQKKPTKKVDPKDNTIYMCLRCKADDFTITQAGAVLCSVCGCLMNNLRVSKTQGDVK